MADVSAFDSAKADLVDVYNIMWDVFNDGYRVDRDDSKRKKPARIPKPCVLKKTIVICSPESTMINLLTGCEPLSGDHELNPVQPARALHARREGGVADVSVAAAGHGARARRRPQQHARRHAAFRRRVRVEDALNIQIFIELRYSVAQASRCTLDFIM